MTNETIYSKRYPRPWEEFEKTKESLKSSKKEEASSRDSDALSFLRQLEERVVFEEIPGREEKAELFVSFAKEFAEREEKDVDIIKCLDRISVFFYMDFAIIGHEPKELMIALFDMADEVQFLSNMNNLTDYPTTIEFDFYTHQHYFKDKPWRKSPTIY